MADASPFKRNKVLGQSFGSEVFRFGPRSDALGVSKKSQIDASQARPGKLEAAATDPEPASEPGVQPPPQEEVVLAKSEGPNASNFVSANREDKNAGLRLSVLLLRLQLASLSSQNNKLRGEIAKKKATEADYSAQVQRLAAVLEDLQLTERLDQEKPSELLKHDMDEIDVALGGISGKLETVTGDSGQDNYLSQVIAKQRDFYSLAEENAAVLQTLCDGIAKFKNTIVSEGKLAERG